MTTTKSRIIQYIVIILIAATAGGGYWYWKQARAAQTVTDNRPSFEAPLTTSLDLAAGQGIATYSRADGADRVATVTDFEGRIIPVKQDEARFEGARRVENLFSYSDDFSDAAWSTQFSASKVGTNQFIIDSASSGSGFYQAMAGTIPVNANRTFRYSIDVQWVSGDTSYQMGGYSNVGFSVSPTANITVSSEWKRFSTIATTGATDATNLSFNIIRGSGTGGTINVRNAQLEDVTSQTNQNPSEYVSTNVETSFPYHGAGVDGVKYFDTENGNTVASNAVTEATGTAIPSSTLHGYLAEGGRTNKLTYSEQFDSWTSDDGSVSADAVSAPDGKSTADKFVSNTNTAQHRVKQTTSFTAGATYTGTVYVKKAGYDYHMKIWSVPGSATMSVDLDTGGIINTGGSEYVGSSVTPLPNGWYRVSLTMTTINGGTYTQMNYLYNNSESFAGDGASGVYLWGAQLEPGNFASSYIPTTSASVTRAKDSLSYPSSGNTEASQGTAVSEIYGSNKDFSTAFDRILSIDDGAANTNTVTLLFNGNVGADQGRAYSGGSSGGVSQTAVGSTTGTKLTSPALLKVGTSWVAGRHTFFDSGVLMDAKTGFTVPITFTDIHIGSSATLATQAFGSIKNVRIWKKALSDTELQNLTSTADAVATSAVRETTVKAPDNADLVGYWSFDEGRGTTAEDFSPVGTGIGTLTNGPTWVDGKSGKALSFDGTDDYVSAADSAVLDTGSLTVSMWFTLTLDPLCDANNNWRSLIRKGATASATTGWDIVLEQGKSFNFDVGLGATSRLAANVGLQVGTPVYLTFTYDAASGVQQVWANGVLKSSQVNTSTAIVANTSPVDIARGTNAVACPNGAGFTPGVYDDVRIYGRALTASEIAGLYRQSESAHTTVNVSQNDQLTNGLVGLWSFDGPDLSGVTAYDRSGNGNDNTLKNGASVYPGKVGQGLNLDGVDDYVCIDDTSTCTVRALFDDVFSSRSVSLWFYPRDVTSTQILFEEGGSWNGFNIYLRSGSLYGGAWSGFGNVYLSGAVTTNVWHHAVIAFEYPGNFSLYLDGMLMDSSAVGGSMGGHTGNDALGAMINDTKIDTGSQSGDGLYFNGRLDEFRVYDRALSVAEVSSLYNLGQ